MATNWWNRKSLFIRLMLTTLLSALFIGMFGSWVIYQARFNAELEKVNNNLQQLVDTVQQTAAISAYLGDKALAQEVIAGLTGNDIIEGVLIINNERVLHSGGRITENRTSLSQAYTLIFPFDQGEVVGELIINPNRELIEQRAGENV